MTLWRTVLSCLGLLAIGCSMGEIAGGNSSETGTVVSVASRASTISVHVNRDLTVELFSSEYVPFNRLGLRMMAKADSGDTVRFTGLQTGSYCVLVTDSASKEGRYFRSIPVAPEATFDTSYQDLAGLGAIQGTALSSQEKSLLDWTYVYIPGSPFWDYTGPSGAFALAGIPAGSFQLRFFGIPEVSCPTPCDIPATQLAEESTTITVIADSTVIWKR